MVLTTTISLEEAQRAKRRQLWLERAGRELEVANAWEASRDPGSMAAHLDRMLEIAAEREAARVETAHPKEQRTFTRWRKPPIVVAISGRSFNTLDWSLGGALLEEVDDRGWKAGQPIEVKIGIEGGKLHSDKLEVVRYVPENRRLAIRTRRFASVFMQIKRDCDAAGMEPV